MNGLDTQLVGLPAAPATPVSPSAPTAAETKAKTIQAAKDFEAVLLHKVMEQMQRTVDKSGLLDDTADEQVQSLFWMNMAQEVSRQGGIGLWKEIYKQMDAAQKSSSVEQLK